MTRDNRELDKSGRIRRVSGPTTDADYTAFEKLCSIQCTAREISAYAFFEECPLQTCRI